MIALAMSAVTDDTIEPYPIPFPPAAFHPYDPNSAVVAGRVSRLITSGFPEGAVEHIGSTAVPDCGGKGVIDLLLMYPAGRLEAAKHALASLGFQRDPRPGIFSEERPMRIGSVRHHDVRYRLHVHVIAADSPEARRLQIVCDALRDDPALVQEYSQLKQALIERGTTDGPEYSEAKSDFIRRVLARHGPGT
jgi:GrpB-like predicted nucleotidyltransferase (UPF0157 family)